MNNYISHAVKYNQAPPTLNRISKNIVLILHNRGINVPLLDITVKGMTNGN